MARRLTMLAPALACACIWLPASAEVAPSFETRQRTLQSVVYVIGEDCGDGTTRAGSGFVFESPGRIVTAHHVVGGCRRLLVQYASAAGTGGALKRATVSKVLSEGDLALLSAEDPPAVPVLRLAAPPPNRDDAYAGSGFQNGQLSAGDIVVKFSAGAAQLRDVLTAASLDELRRTHSPIRTDRSVLRFNIALQPGMSGGPIVNAKGEVIGIVAGGLKSGAANASWGWPSEWVRDLMASSEDANQTVFPGGVYYSRTDLQVIAKARASNRRITCGTLEFEFTGTRGFSEVARGADDYPRVQHLMTVSRLPQQTLEAYQFDVWTHTQSGATAVAPSGYALQTVNGVCVARSKTGVFEQVIWAGKASGAQEIQMRSVDFEQKVILPRVPYQFGFTIDPQLTTYTPMGVPGPQFRDNGMVFNRKGFTQAKEPVPYFGAFVPLAHSFVTLVARTGTFLGVGTIDNDLPPWLNQCVQMGSAADLRCPSALQHLEEWTHFVLATQLSTYPSF